MEPRPLMSNAEGVPTVEQALSRVMALSAGLAERANESEQLRGVPEASIRAFLEAGLHKMIQPQRFGGWGMGWETHVAAAIEWGKADGSQGWVLTRFGDQAQLVGMFEQQAQEEVWGEDPATLVSGSLAPRGRLVPTSGGYLASGQWSWASGIDQAKWLLAGGVIEESEKRRRIYFLVPKSQASVNDDWQVSGLSGTGSKSFTLEDVFVPLHRILESKDSAEGTAPGGKVNPEPVYRFPREGFSLALACVPLGVAATMIEDFIAMVRDTPKRGVRVPTNFAAALRIAESRAEVDAASVWALTAARATMQMLGRGEQPSAEQRALNTLRAGYATQLAARAADRLWAGAGAKAIFLTNRLPRRLCDIHAATAHEALSWDHCAAPYGTLRLGESAS